MSKKKVEVDLEVKSNLEPSLKNLRELKKQLRGLSADSAEYKKVSADIRDMDDALKGAAVGADDFMGSLEGASGPLGVAARGLKSLETSFSTFNGALKASVIGFIVAALGGLVAAFRSNEEAMKKLEPVMVGVEKILGGIFRAAEPLLDIFVELAMEVLPVLTNVIGGVYSAFSGLFTFIREYAVSVAKIMKGIFTLDLSSIEEGVDTLTSSFGKAWDATKETYGKFQEGSKELTKTEKEQIEARKKAEEEAAAKRKELAEKELARRKADLDARITLETNAENTSREKLKSLLDKRMKLEIDNANLTNAQKDLIRQEYAKKLEDALEADKKVRVDKRNAELDALIQLEEEKEITSREKLKTLLDERMRVELDNVELTEAEKEVIRLKYAKQLEEAIKTDDQKLEEKRVADFEKDVLYLEEKYGEFKQFDENYYSDLRALYDKNAEDLKIALDSGAISQDDYTKKLSANSKARRELDKLEQLSAIEKTKLVSNALGQLSSIMGEQTAAGKAFAIAQTTIDTYQSATAAYKALAGIPVVGPALGAIAAAAAVAGGIANIKKITSVQLPGGGGNSSGTGGSSTPAAPGSRPTIATGVIPIGSASPVRRAQGGIVRGAGGDFTDSIPALLSNGEFVVNARSTRLFQPLLSSINDMGNMPRFAAGGLVNKPSMPTQDNTERIVEVIGQTLSQAPIRTYVSSTEISNTQQFDRVIKSRSLI